MTPSFPVVIFHNPDCETSRNVLRIIEAAGYRPEIALYVQTGWTRGPLLALLAAAGLSLRAALRESKSPAKELGLLEPGVDDAALLAAMLTHPVLVNRPLVATPKGVKLCRPSETVLDLLATWPKGPFYKEDGALLIDADGNRH